MKKSYIALFSIFLLFAFLPFKVDAANICTGSKYNELKREAYQVELSWELKFDKDNNHYFQVTVANMNKNILLVFGDVTYEGDNNKNPILIEATLEGGNTYEFKFYGGYDNPCVEEYIYTKRLELPKYNKYNELEECIEYEEFPLCNKWYSGDIKDEDYFLEQLEIYKKSLEKPEEPKPEIDNRTIFDKIIDFYIGNIVITLPITVLLFILIIVIIISKIKKSKNKVKIDLKV